MTAIWGGFDITFHGVRGSTPCDGEGVARHGGNTSCVSVDVPGHDPVLFDLGTGLRYFGLSRPAGEVFNGTCLLSHLHWDHVQGLPFFTPLLRQGAHLDVYAPVQADGRSLADVIGSCLCPPMFPIGIEDLPGIVDFKDTADDRFAIGEIEVLSRLIPHVGNTCGYRLSWRGASVAYLSDHQQIGARRGEYEMTDGARDLCQGVDVLIHDAQYTPDEFAVKSTWGHCTVDYAVWLATECGVKTLAMFHHDPLHDDDQIDALAAEANASCVGSGLEVIAAREGLTVHVGTSPAGVVSTVSFVASVLLGAAFVLAGASKLALGKAWPAQAADLGAPRWAAPVVPWVEMAVGAALIAQLLEPVPAVAAILMLLAFTALILVRLSEGRHPPCACFGAWSAKPIGPAHLARNGVLLALGLLALYP